MKPTTIVAEGPKQYKDLVSRGNTVIAGLTGNLSFTTPSPTIIILQNAVTDVNDAITKWGDVHNRGSHADLLDLRAKALTLYNLLRAEAAYVQNTAQLTAGTDYVLMTSIIESSGFDMKHAKHPEGVLQMVQNYREFVSRKLNSNQKELRWKKPLGMTKKSKAVYKIYMADTNNFSAALTIDTVDTTKYIYTNTTSAVVTKTFWVIPHGTMGDGVRSEGITLTITGAV